MEKNIQDILFPYVFLDYIPLANEDANAEISSTPAPAGGSFNVERVYFLDTGVIFVIIRAMNKPPLVQLQNVSKSFEDQSVLSNIEFEIHDGEFLTILGPSGCGKTTLLRILSGFEEPDSGVVSLRGKDITKVPPEQRNVNLVFQSYALFPHMSVYENVAFGLRCEGVAKNLIEPRVTEILQRVKLIHLMHRMPAQLSGGQQQRVAIARALVKQPQMLLLDEPLSALDLHLRKEMRIELKALQRKLGITFILVTHDQEEALSLSDRIVVMDHGRIEQVGTPRAIYENPVNLHVARFIGEANIFKTMVTDVNAKLISVNIVGTPLVLKTALSFEPRQMVNIVVRPEDIEVWGKNEVQSHEGMMEGTVIEVIYKGSTVDLKVQLANKQIIAATEFFDEDDENLFYEMGESVWIHWKLGWEVILPDEG